MQFCPLVIEIARAQILCHIQTNRQGDRQTNRQVFVRIVKSCRGHSKMCKSIKNWKSKIFAIPILFFFFFQNKKKRKNSCWIYWKMQSLIKSIHIYIFHIDLIWANLKTNIFPSNNVIKCTNIKLNNFP